MHAEACDEIAKSAHPYSTLPLALSLSGSCLCHHVTAFPAGKAANDGCAAVEADTGLSEPDRLGETGDGSRSVIRPRTKSKTRAARQAYRQSRWARTSVGRRP